MNDAMAASAAQKESSKGTTPKVRELKRKSPTVSLKGWRKLRSIGALQISEGSAAAVEWRRALQGARLKAKQEQEEALAQESIPEDVEDAGPSTPEFYTPRSEDEFYSPRGEGGGVGSTPAERRILFDDRRSNAGPSVQLLLPRSFPSLCELG